MLHTEKKARKWQSAFRFRLISLKTSSALLSALVVRKPHKQEKTGATASLKGTPASFYGDCETVTILRNLNLLKKQACCKAIFLKWRTAPVLLAKLLPKSLRRYLILNTRFFCKTQKRGTQGLVLNQTRIKNWLS